MIAAAASSSPAQEARRIARRQRDGALMSSLLTQSRGIRDEISMRGGTPKNHARENVRQIRRMQLEKQADMQVRLSRTVV